MVFALLLRFCDRPHFRARIEQPGIGVRSRREHMVPLVWSAPGITTSSKSCFAFTS
jgi:hypothetical protein